MRPGLRPLLAVGALWATLALATPPPFDFTGTWTGTVAAPGTDTFGVNATFTSTGPRTFAGSVTFPFPDKPPAEWLTCQVSGTYGRRVKLHAKCPHAPGKKGGFNLRARLDPTAETLTAPVRVRELGHGRHRGTFTLTKLPAEEPN
jgi:hypothetical protein